MTTLAHTLQYTQPVACRPIASRRVHLVGIAGAGMRSLAEVLVGQGWQLSGSDPHVAQLPHLEAAGVFLADAHNSDNLPPTAELVVYSDAVSADNPELRRAAELGIARISYFEMLGRMMAGRQGLAVAGTHGKSTTTAMAAEVLVGAGLDPTVVFGATPLGPKKGPGLICRNGPEGASHKLNLVPFSALGQLSGGRPGRGELMLVEACEYRSNFLHLRPQLAVILGIEPDHFDCFDSPAALERAFSQLARSLPEEGLILARHDCQATRRVVARAGCRVETFGLEQTLGSNEKRDQV